MKLNEPWRKNKIRKAWTVGWEEACKQRLPILGLQDGNFLSAGSPLQNGPCTASFRGNEDRSRQVSSWFKNKISNTALLPFFQMKNTILLPPTSPKQNKNLPKTKQTPEGGDGKEGGGGDSELSIFFPVGALHMTSEPVPLICLCSPQPSGTWRAPGLSIFLMLSSHLFFMSALSSSPFHWTFQDGFGQTW